MSCFSLFTGSRWKCRFRQVGAMASARQLATSSWDQELPRLCWLVLSIEPGCHQTWPKCSGGGGRTKRDALLSCWNARTHTHTHTQAYRHTTLCPFVRDQKSSRVPEETFTHSHTSWSSDILYQLPPSTTIHCILCVQFTCLTVLFNNLSPGPLWSSSWPWTRYFILHAFLHPIIVFFSHTVSCWKWKTNDDCQHILPFNLTTRYVSDRSVFCSVIHVREWSIRANISNIHCIPQKMGDTILVVISLSNLNRFSKFFHWLILK